MKGKLGKILLGILCSLLVFGVPYSIGQTQHNITLSWNASLTTGVKYVVYRGTSPSGPFTQIATDIAALTYVDSLGTGGTTYYYTVAAICDTTTACPSGISGLSAQTSPSVGLLFLGSPAAPGAAPTGVSN